MPTNAHVKRHGPTEAFTHLVCRRISEEIEWEYTSVAAAARDLGIAVRESTYRGWKEKGGELIDADVDQLTDYERRCVDLYERVTQAEYLAQHNWRRRYFELVS